MMSDKNKKDGFSVNIDLLIKLVAASAIVLIIAATGSDIKDHGEQLEEGKQPRVYVPTGV